MAELARLQTMPPASASLAAHCIERQKLQRGGSGVAHRAPPGAAWGTFQFSIRIESIRFDMFNVLGGNWDPTDKINHFSEF